MSYSNQYTQPRSSPSRYDYNPAVYNQWSAPNARKFLLLVLRLSVTQAAVRQRLHRSPLRTHIMTPTMPDTHSRTIPLTRLEIRHLL